MASSSSLSRSWLYHVFLSFRGEDVRKGFLSHVMKELKSKGILPFLDNEMKRGESIDAELIGAIRQSRVAVVLLSRNYASSSWCLDELVEIMTCREEDGQTVMTIFYEVDPSDVRKQTGDFGKAFEKTCEGKTEEVKKAWRKALKDVAGIAGYASRNSDNEAEMINKVALDVTAVLGFTPSRDFDDFVGIEGHITEIKSKLILQTEQVKVIGVVGPPGIGKTTTARALYNQLSPGFSFSTFLENIRGSYEKPCGNDYQLKLRLQKNLLTEIFNKKDIEVRHLGAVQQMLSDKKVLVVLDEVDSWWQLEEMAKQRGWFGPGSIIIITTEDRKPLKQLRLGINHIYKMKFPTGDEALKIFCQYAFGQKSPDYGFEMLSWEVIWLAGKLPLGLRVMGSYVRGMSREEWIDALPRLRSSLDTEIESTLRFSYDGLTEKDKAIFLHIACFFEHSEVDDVKSCLEKSGLEVNHGLQVLADKSLISIELGWVNMHPLLQKMGREIVKKESLKEPGKRQFLWDTNEISDVLEGETGTGTVLGIRLWVSIEEEIQVSKSAFDGMNNLQLLKVYPTILIQNKSTSLCIPDGLNCLPNKLRYIEWNYCPLRIWPSKFSGKFLVKLIMQHSKFEKLWEGIQPLQCLKVMDLGSSKYLKEIPDLSKATSLEKLDLWQCESLLELTSSIGNATKLRYCDLSRCCRLKEIPSSIGRLVKLEVLNLSGCSSLTAISLFSGLENLSGCSSLKELRLSDTAIEEMPSSMSTWSCLYNLDMAGCRNLKKFPNVPDSIVELWLSGTGIEEIPPSIGKLFRLLSLNMDGCEKLKRISPNISKLENLQNLKLSNRCKDSEEKFRATIDWGPDLNRRWSLESTFKVDYILPICLPDKVLSSPLSLYFYGDGFKTIPDYIRSFSGLSKLNISNCKELVAIPPLPGSLLSLAAQGCRSLKRIDSSSFQNPNIRLNFARCYNLNQKARKLIQTSASKYAVLPGEEVPPYFPQQDISGSLTINLTSTPLPSSVSFKACILLPYNKGLPYHSRAMDEDKLTNVSCCVRGKQNGLPIEYTSNKHRITYRHGYDELADHLYIFEDSFCLNQDCPEAEDATFSELSFVFIVCGSAWKGKGCGVRLLNIPHCGLDGIDDESVDDDKGESVDDEDESDDDEEDENADIDDEDENVGDGDDDKDESDTLHQFFWNGSLEGFNYSAEDGYFSD